MGVDGAGGGGRFSDDTAVPAGRLWGARSRRFLAAPSVTAATAVAAAGALVAAAALRAAAAVAAQVAGGSGCARGWGCGGGLRSGGSQWLTAGGALLPAWVGNVFLSGRSPSILPFGVVPRLPVERGEAVGSRDLFLRQVRTRDISRRGGKVTSSCPGPRWRDRGRCCVCMVCPEPARGLVRARSATT